MSGQIRGASKKGRIAQDLLELITSGKVGPGERLPTEAQLAERYGVTRPTVREAYRLLIERQAVVSLGLAGYFARQRLVTRWELSRCGDYLDPWEIFPPAGRSLREQIAGVEMLTGRTRLPGCSLGEAFGLGEEDRGDYVCRFELRTVDNRPVQLSYVYAPASLAGGTEFCRPEPMECGAVALLGERAGGPPREWSDSVSCRVASVRESGLLEIGEGATVLEAVRQVRFQAGGPILMVERLVIDGSGGAFVVNGGSFVAN